MRMTRAGSLALRVAACAIALARPAAAGETDAALAAALAEQRALLLEAQARGEVKTPFPTAHLDAFEAALVAQDLLAPPGEAEATLVFTPPVSSPPRELEASRSQRERARLAQLVASRAPEAQVEPELDTLVRDEPPGTDARELVQDLIFRAVAITAVELRQQLEELRRSEAVRAVLREQLLALRASLSAASAQARSVRERELRGLESQADDARERAGQASRELAVLLRDHEALFDHLARLGGRLYARAKIALREAGG